MPSNHTFEAGIHSFSEPFSWFGDEILESRGTFAIGWFTRPAWFSRCAGELTCVEYTRGLWVISVESLLVFHVVEYESLQGSKEIGISCEGKAIVSNQLPLEDLIRLIRHFCLSLLFARISRLV